MNEDFTQVDDTTLLLMRQAAVDSGNADRRNVLDAEVARRTAVIRVQLGGGR